MNSPESNNVAASPPAEMGPVAADLQGLWQRTNLTRANGMVDETTFVRWGQVGRHYVDIRIPVEAAGAGPFGRVGFAGHIDAGGGLCEWHRTIDFQPPNGGRDVARVTLSGETLHEAGSPDVGSPATYDETFVRIKTGAQRAVALERDDGNALLLMIDDVFLYAHQRPEPLPQHASLHDYVATGASLERVYACEISMGALDPGQRQLIISHSVNPLRKGCPLLFGSATVQQKWRVLLGVVDDALRPYLLPIEQGDQ